MSFDNVPLPSFPGLSSSDNPDLPDPIAASRPLDSSLDNHSSLSEDSSRLLSSVLRLMGNLEQDKVLQAFVDQACAMTSSPLWSLSYLGFSRGNQRFLYSRGERKAACINGASPGRTRNYRRCSDLCCA